MPLLEIDLFRPPFPAWVTIALTAVILAGAAWHYLRRHTAESPTSRFAGPVLLALRGTALAGLLWVLMGPSVLEQADPRSRQVPVWLLADTSASMAEVDVVLHGPEPLSRWEALRRTWLSKDALTRLKSLADVTLYRFDDGLSPMSPATLAKVRADGDATKLFDALHRVVTMVRPEAAQTPILVILSDGHATHPAPHSRLLERLRQRGIRVCVVPVGSTDRAADIAVQAWLDADFLFEGQSTTLHAAVVQHGLDDRAARVELLHDGRVIQQRQVSFKRRSVRQVEFELTPHSEPGRSATVHGYQVRARLIDPAGGLEPPGATDSYDANNQRTVFVQVSREQIRVALFEGEPYWDTRSLARVLRQDPQVQLHAFFGLGERLLTITSPDATDVPVVSDGAPTAAMLNPYDVVILGRGVERFFPGDTAGMLVDFVRRRGGALVLARGRPFDVTTEAGRQAAAMLAPIEPVTWAQQAVERLTLQLTPAGEQSPLLSFEQVGPTQAVLTRLPGMLAATRIEDEKAASIVLLRQAGRAMADGGGRMADKEQAMAAVSYLRVGRGQVMAILTDGLWRWSLLPTQLARYDSVYDLFWSRAIRWLAAGGEFLPGQAISLSLDRLTVEPGQVVEATITTRYVNDARFAPRLRLIAPDGSDRMIQPTPDPARQGSFHATLRPEHAGLYRLELSTPEGGDLIDPATPIVSRLAVHERSLERLDPSARPELLERLAEATGGRVFELEHPEQLPRYVRQMRQARTVQAKPTYDFAHPEAFALIAGCLGLEWLVRRRRGLL